MARKQNKPIRTAKKDTSVGINTRKGGKVVKKLLENKSEKKVEAQIKHVKSRANNKKAVQAKQILSVKSTPDTARRSRRTNSVDSKKKSPIVSQPNTNKKATKKNISSPKTVKGQSPNKQKRGSSEQSENKRRGLKTKVTPNSQKSIKNEKSEPAKKKADNSMSLRGKKRSYAQLASGAKIEDENVAKKRKAINTKKDVASRGSRSIKPTAKGSEWRNTILQRKSTVSKQEKATKPSIKSQSKNKISVTTSKSPKQNKKAVSSKIPTANPRLNKSATKTNSIKQSKTSKQIPKRQRGERLASASKVIPKPSSAKSKAQKSVVKPDIASRKSRRSRKSETEQDENNEKAYKSNSLSMSIKNKFNSCIADGKKSERSNLKENVLIAQEILHDILSSVPVENMDILLSAKTENLDNTTNSPLDLLQPETVKVLDQDAVIVCRTDGINSVSSKTQKHNRETNIDVSDQESKLMCSEISPSIVGKEVVASPNTIAGLAPETGFVECDEKKTVCNINIDNEIQKVEVKEEKVSILHDTPMVPSINESQQTNTQNESNKGNISQIPEEIELHLSDNSVTSINENEPVSPESNASPASGATVRSHFTSDGSVPKENSGDEVKPTTSTISFSSIRKDDRYEECRKENHLSGNSQNCKISSSADSGSLNNLKAVGMSEIEKEASPTKDSVPSTELKVLGDSSVIANCKSQEVSKGTVILKVQEKTNSCDIESANSKNTLFIIGERKRVTIENSQNHTSKNDSGLEGRNFAKTETEDGPLYSISVVSAQESASITGFNTETDKAHLVVQKRHSEKVNNDKCTTLEMNHNKNETLPLESNLTDTNDSSENCKKKEEVFVNENKEKCISNENNSDTVLNSTKDQETFSDEQNKVFNKSELITSQMKENKFTNSHSSLIEGNEDNHNIGVNTEREKSVNLKQGSFMSNGEGNASHLISSQKNDDELNVNIISKAQCVTSPSSKISLSMKQEDKLSKPVVNTTVDDKSSGHLKQATSETKESDELHQATNSKSSILGSGDHPSKNEVQIEMEVANCHLDTSKSLEADNSLESKSNELKVEEPSSVPEENSLESVKNDRISSNEQVSEVISSEVSSLSAAGENLDPDKKLKGNVDVDTAKTVDNTSQRKQSFDEVEEIPQVVQQSKHINSDGLGVSLEQSTLNIRQEMPSVEIPSTDENKPPISQEHSSLETENETAYLSNSIGSGVMNLPSTDCNSEKISSSTEDQCQKDSAESMNSSSPVEVISVDDNIVIDTTHRNMSSGSNICDEEKTGGSCVDEEIVSCVGETPADIDIQSSEMTEQLTKMEEVGLEETTQDSIIVDDTDGESMQCNSETPSSNRMSVDEENPTMEVDSEDATTVVNTCPTYETKTDSEMNMEVS